MKIKIPYSKGIEIYNKSPLWMKDIYSIVTSPIPRSLMFGSAFHDYYKELDKTQWYTPNDLKQIQEKKLRALIKHAYFNVPYYHKLFQKINLSYNDVRTIEDLQKIPTLTKDDIRNHFNDLIAVNAKEYKYGIGKTSGSTGIPLKFLLDQQNREMEYALVWRQLKWAGIGLNAKVATLRGDLVNETGRKEILWTQNALSKELVFNTFDMSEAAIQKIVDKLSNFKPDVLKGYPSSLYIVASYMMNQGIECIKPVAIQTSSEMLSENQRKIIQKQFNCDIFDWYGHSEYAISAGECEEHEGYHLSVESGIWEFAKNNENVNSGELGEIIATGLCNYSMPLIRYKTSDIGSYTDEKCNCGRGLPIMESLEGRVGDMISSPSGKIISGMSFEHYWKHRISNKTPNLEYVHVVQKAKNKLLVEIIRNKQFSEVEINHILRELNLLLGNDMIIEFKEIDIIPTGKKWRFTESDVFNDFV